MTQAYQYFGGFQPTQQAFSLGEATQAVNANRQLDAKRAEKQARMAYYQGLGNDATEDQYNRGVAEFPEHEKSIRDHQERSYQNKLGQVINGDMDVDDLRKSNPGKWKQTLEGMAANDQFQNEAVGQIASRVAFAYDNEDPKTMKRELESARTVFEAEDNQFALSTINTQLENLNSGDPERMKKAGKSAKGLWALSSEESYKKWSDSKYTDTKTERQNLENKLYGAPDAPSKREEFDQDQDKIDLDSAKLLQKQKEWQEGEQKDIPVEVMKQKNAYQTEAQEAIAGLSMVAGIRPDIKDRGTQGWRQAASSFFKNALGYGSDEEITEAKTRRLVAKYLADTRVPGIGSQSDVEFKAKMATALRDNASTEETNAFVDMYEKRALMKAAYAQANAEFLDGNGGIGKAFQEIPMSSGINVEKNQTIAMYWAKNKDKLISKLKEEHLGKTDLRGAGKNGTGSFEEKMRAKYTK
jgi:hypothetical protein